MKAESWKFGILLAVGCTLFLDVPTAWAKTDSRTGCDAETFHCNSELAPGEQCIPNMWVCDGEMDCPGGEDEEQNCPPPTCKEGQFQCKQLAVCIPEGWLCDQEEDCEDASDEDPQLCSTHKKNKGTRIRGGTPNEFHCLPNMYQCPGTQHCIPIENICNGDTDCDKDSADEGAICMHQQGSSNSSCDIMGCEHGCKESLQGSLCYCEKGFAPIGKTCGDIDECSYDGYCDQVCQNSQGSYSCSCVAGYTLIHQSSCQANKDSTSTLLFTSTFSVQQTNLDGSDLNTPFIVKGKAITAMDFNYRNNTVCWVSKTDKIESDWRSHHMKCASLNDRFATWTIYTQSSVDSIDQMALDWLTGNWYFTDYGNSRLFVCTSTGQHCLSIIHTEINKPRGLALDPLQGYVFYSDWGSHPKIERADMDGSNRQPIVTLKIIQPRGLAVDLANQHLYWSDAYLDHVERCDYDGKNRKIIFHGEMAEHVYGVSIFENFLYLANQHAHQVLRVHRFGNLTYPPKVLVQNLTRPAAVHVVHKQRQPEDPSNPCVDNGQCEHICFPLRVLGKPLKKCACQAGYLIKDNGKCEAANASQFLLYANSRQGIIHGISLDLDHEGELMPPIEGLDRPLGLAFDPMDKVVYYSEIGKYHISKRGLNSATSEVVLSEGITSVEGLAIDWLSRNLYWTDDGKKTINVARLNDFSIRLVLIQENLTHPKAIVLDPTESYMYFADWISEPSGSKAKIERANMDGTGRKTLVTDRVQWPSSLFFDQAQKKLYWTDVYYQKIQSVEVANPKNIVTVLPAKAISRPYCVVSVDNMLYWTELSQGHINAYDMTTNKSHTLRLDSAPLSLILVETTIPKGQNNGCAVNNGNCSDLCLPTPQGGKNCTCSVGRRLLSDKLNCEAIPGFTESPKTCDPDTKFQCNDGSCINKKYKCDGKPDCLDNSDEDKATTCANHDCGDMMKCQSNLCINRLWRCDGAFDCPDGDDEENCIGQTSCPEDHQSCNNGRCIPNQWWCDHEEDCPEGEDEKQCSSSYDGCSPGQFKCDNNQCIPYAYRCDRDKDCMDNSDEFFCHYQCDFRCKNNSMCFPITYKCDGDKNCADGSDEWDCPVVLGGCHDNEYACRNGDCIPKRWRCDRDNDCSDSSDEFNCTSYNIPQCAKNEFQCKSSGRCLLNIWKCDKESDCEDNSDEEGCTYQAACSYPKRTCKNNTMVCLSPEKLCDGRNDCEDHSDEGGLCALGYAYNLCANHDCSHQCSRAPDGFVCTCPDNMKLRSDNRTCIDIDICETWGICGQACNSTRDGYKCVCLEGYEIDDGYACKPINKSETYIIFSNRHEIRRVDPFTKQTVSLVSGLQNTIALDYSYKRNWIFWTDVVDDKIWRGTMISNSVTNIQPIIDVGLATTEGLAIDWIGENIYWVESNLDQIEVAKLDGSDRTTLIAGGMVSPRAIVLDPRDGALFWTDWDGKEPRIEGCSMSGENRTVVFDIRSIPSGGWPNGLAIDYDFRRLYWIDARSDSVHTTKYDGSDHRLILKGHPHLSHPFAVSLFGVYIYWTDWRTNSLVRANKFNGSESEVIQKTISQPFDLQVYSKYRQPDAPNPCAENNGGCSHLCLLNYNNTVGCRCPHLKRLKDDRKTCEDDNKFLLFAKLSEIRGVDLKDAHFNVIPSITVPYVDRPSAVDYDVKHERIYWTDLGLDSINSAFLNGTGFETIIDTGIPSPTGFAVDWVSRNMYFTSNGTKGITISVANLNGAYRRVLIADNITSPNSLAVHPSKGYLFWSDDGGPDHKIVRARMDGTNPTTIVTGTNVKGPASLTVDMKSNKLYWINKETKVISLCDFNGENHEDLNIPGDVVDPVTITVYGQSLYVAGKDLIGELNKNGEGFKRLRDSTPGVKAMRVYDPSGRSSGTNECAKDNGGCAQLCLPVRTLQRVCKCTAGYQLMADNKGCTGIKSFLMYSSGTKIQGIALDPTDTVLEGLPPISKINMASAVDFYAKEDYIYWVDSTSRKISRIKRDLTNRETIIKDGLSGVDGLAVDWVAGNIYWTDHGLHTIEVARLNGSSRYVLLHGNMDKPRSIVVFPGKGYMFWADWGTGKIERSYLDGTNRTAIITTNIQAPNGLTIDYEMETLYWCDQRMNKIESCDLNGDNRKVIVRNVTDCKSLTLFQEYIYWIDTTELGGSIKRANKLDGSQITPMRTDLGSDIKDLKVFDLQKQRDTNICATTNGWCAELCLYRGDLTTTCACAYGKLDEDGKSCKEYDAFLLFSKVVTIESIMLRKDVNPNSPIPKIEDATNMRNVIGLAYDYKNKLVFFSDIQRGDIQQVHFNGSNIKVLVKGVGSAEGLAYDQHTNYLYWTSYSESSIERLKLGDHSGDVEKDRVVKLQSDDHPRAIVINSCGSSMGQLFWTNWNDRRPSIQRSYMDGSDIRNIITTDIRTPNGLTIDHKGQSLYWSDARLDKIERCDFNGMNRVVILTSIPQHSFGLAVYGEFIFWTDWVLRAVLRANKYDGSGITRLRKGTQRQPMAIIAVGGDVNDCQVNPCYNNILGCEFNCTVNTAGEAMCVCPEEQILLSDNRSCAVRDQLCGKDQFVCGNGLCIPYLLTCNNVTNCPDNSDENEQFCLSRECPSQYYMCANRRCIEASKRCDNANDCGDASDECGCHNEKEFRCDNGICIKAIYRCDRDNDCADTSDEKGCNLTCANLEVNGQTLEGLVSCNTTSACILPSWICDGNDDCWDNNDEKNCTHPIVSQCSDGGFQCDSGNCIPKGWHCDKDNDCGDNSDEEGCEYTCEARQWKCERDSTCIPSPWRCDGHPDCLDKSDELNCEKSNCSKDEFHCHSGRCIPLMWVCDGDADCEKDGEDESPENGCAPNTCDKDEFMCRNRRCIRASFYCDHDIDCEDESDEPPECRNSSCSPNEFRCDNQQCIPRNLRCDGMPHCGDHSDEDNCTTAPPLPCGTTNTTVYKCKNGACINDSLVCDGHNDCGDYSDESEKCGKNECKGIRPCAQLCTDKKIGYECSCFSGYTYNQTSNKCDDVDECIGNPCDHYCYNTNGRFYCICAEGYSLEPDGRSCKVSGSGVAPHILVSNRYYLRKMNFSGSTVELITDRLNNAVAVDFDWSGNDTYVYWSDITTSVSKISRLKVDYRDQRAEQNPPANKIEILHDSTVRNPDGIAVDWVAGNLYWCDKTTDTIEVSRLDGKYRKVLVREGLQEPRALEVFPQKGLLFYTDWGDKAHVSRINMDGTNPVNIITDDLSWPNALTIDYIAEKLFWADASLDYIAMADLDGNNKKVIVSQSLPHVFAITTFGSYLFWTDWETQSIFRARKFSGENVTEVARLIHRPMDIQIYHPLRRVPLTGLANPCEDNGGCGNLCLLRPGENGRLEKTCACPENHDLAYDNATCIANCTSAQILCDKTYKCIPFWWQCDGHKDCEDGSDEPATCGDYHCSQPGLYQCKNATSDTDCLPPTQICDGKAQCLSGSDEEGCENYHCMHNQFKCTSGKFQCIAKILKCDRNHDCADGEDEADCPTISCAVNQFQCSNERCVPYVWRCDLDDDCGDASDEPENCTELACQEGYLKCRKTGRCIPKSWQCDGDNDCGSEDITDEDPQLCSNVTCQPSYFQCDNNRCIPNRWTCDYDDDCRDGSDEKTNCTARDCSESERRCNNEKCVQGSLWCDGVANCDDGSDEVNCTNTDCQEDTQFTCTSGDHCIPNVWKCDGDRDCSDGSDEKDCGDSVCPPGEFRCSNSGCRPMAWRCDGEDDCGDNSDEEPKMCSNLTCPPERFRCGNHKCIWWSRVCDGEDSCGDKSDEMDCYKNHQVECKDSDFRCVNDSSCVTFARVCNGEPDCKDGSDEAPTMCRMRNRTCTATSCEYKCKQLPYGISCECHKGYRLAEDGRKCEDDDECERFDTCSQICHNFPGTYKCKCDDGYEHGRNQYKHRCVAKGRAAYMLIAEEDQLKKLNVVKNSPQLDLLKEEKNQKIDSVAVDINIGKAFVVSHEDRQIRTFSIPDITKNVNLKNEEKRVKRKAGQSSLSLPLQNLQEPRGIAVDWINQHIYWTDSASQTISLADYEGKRQITVISSHLGEPFAIAVEPHAAKIFWTDRGLFAKLESANLDGSDRKVLADKNILWPVGLTIDYPAKRLYWTDAKAHTVEAVKLDGSGRHLVKKMNASDPPYMIDVFEDKMYVTTSKKHNVLMMSKFGDDNDTETLVEKIEHIGAIVIVQEIRQKQLNQTDDSCANLKCGQGLCVNMPSSPKGHICLCPDGASWNNTHKRCEFKPLVGPQCEPGYCMYEGKCSIEDKKQKCKCKPGYHGDRCQNYACRNHCLNFGFCFIDKFGSPQCSCIQPFGGKRCENNLCSGFHCYNGGTCAVKRNNMNYCKCLKGFKGRLCEECSMLCYNGGTCKADVAQGKTYCVCVPGYDPDYRCKRSGCDNHACQHGGECVIKDGYPLCNCQKDFSGKHCEHRAKPQLGAAAGTGTIVGILVVGMVILLVLLGIFLYRKRKSLHRQFKHRRIQDNSNVEINNPIYLPGDYDDDPEPEADERQPLGDTYQFEQDKSTNFANPMYDTLYTETSQGLVPANKAERNQLLDDSLKVRYYSNGSKKSGNNSYA